MSPAYRYFFTLSLHDALPIWIAVGAIADLVLFDPDTVDERATFAQPRLCEGGALVHGVRVEQDQRSEEHTSELQSRGHLVCRLLLEKKKRQHNQQSHEQQLNI